MGYVVNGKGYTTEHLIELALRDIVRKAHESAHRRIRTLVLNELADRHPEEYRDLYDARHEVMLEGLHPQKVSDSEIQALEIAEELHPGRSKKLRKKV